MPVHFIDNYPKNNLESKICKKDGTPLFGEIWVYKELLKFNENGFLSNETWYVKHNYNLSRHPSSEGKVEGQIDYLIVSRFGILIIEVKGGGIEVDEYDTYYSYDSKDKSKRYESQNPFNQAKEYVHSLKNLIDSNPFIYRAVIFPHESGFRLLGPQLSGYEYLFFSKKNIDAKGEGFPQNELFFNFLIGLARDARKNIILQLNPNIDKQKLAGNIWQKFPDLNKKEIERIKSELFPIQDTYGFNPDKIRNEIILEENYEILKGLRKNKKVMVQGAPGTGKTVLATKFLAENIIKQHKGIFFCANKLLKSKMEFLIFEEYKLDPNLIKFRIYYEGIKPEEIDEEIDFIIIDEAQEFFDKGIYDFIHAVDKRLKSPKWLILYDPEQTIIQDFKDIDWYTDFFMESSFVHYLFDTVWRCSQNEDISIITSLLKTSQYKKIHKDYSKFIIEVKETQDKIKEIKNIIDIVKNEFFKHVILIDSSLYDAFKEIANDYFEKELEELTEANINLKNKKIRFTTPIKYRGLEAENVIIITSGFTDKTRIQNFIGATRAIYQLNFILWS